VDFSRASLCELARRRPQARSLALVQADATRLPLAPDRFDAVVSAQTLEHLPSLAARSALYRCVDQALAPAGVFVCTA
jgi:ubiquinone/menaquinone biosynthesis C-methylase UbiE